MSALVAVAHGTRSPVGQRQIRDLVGRVAARRAELDVRLCYVDVQQPRAADVLPSISDAVVVPLLLSTGHHVRVDIASAAVGRARVTPPLGPDPRLTQALAGQLGRADAVVLAAAGSSDPGWRADVGRVADDLGAHVAYVAHVREVVADLRARGAERITIAAYLLADGLFYRRLHQAGATTVTPPLCHDPAVADLIMRRYDLTFAHRPM